jgi:pilus assembly protein CpaB
MQTARIVVLTIAHGAGSVAAYLPSGSDNKLLPEPTAQLQTVDVLVAKSDIGLGDSVSAVRYGVSSSTTITKLPKGRTI